MAATIEAYYDFRSPYAYFANHRIRGGSFVAPVAAKWIWRPVSIDVLLNLQAGRDAWAAYADPLSAPKRAHLLADVRRCAASYEIPLHAPKPPRPNSIPALCVAALLDPESHDIFRNAVFDALWHQQRDVGESSVLEDYLMRAGRDPGLVRQAGALEARDALAEATTRLRQWRLRRADLCPQRRKLFRQRSTGHARLAHRPPGRPNRGRGAPSPTVNYLAAGRAATGHQQTDRVSCRIAGSKGETS